MLPDFQANSGADRALEDTGIAAKNMVKFIF